MCSRVDLPPTASTEGSTGVLASLTASRISAEAEAHPLGLTGKADEADGCGQQDNYTINQSIHLEVNQKKY